MARHSEILAKAIRRAKASIASGDLQQPQTIMYTLDHVHRFNYPFMGSNEGAAAALFVKAACQVLKPEYVVSAATVAMATSDSLPAGETPVRSSVGQEALFVALTRPDTSVEIYLGKVVRGTDGEIREFEEVTGLDADDRKRPAITVS